MSREAVREIVGVLLAAGAGRRFGGDKLSHPLPDGTPMAVAAATNLLRVCARVIAVLRPNDEQLADLLAVAGCEIVFCADAERGMGHSLAAGVRAGADAAGWVVALGDMPFITTSSHLAVVDRLQSGASLVATQYRGQRGHPVGFSREWFHQLSGMAGDQGARTILETHREGLVLCPVDDAGVLLDIDRRDDLPALDHQHLAA